MHTDVSLFFSPPRRSPSSSNVDLLISHPSRPRLQICICAMKRTIRTKHKDQASEFDFVTSKKSNGCIPFSFLLTVCQMLLQMRFRQSAMDFLHIHRATRANWRHSRECFRNTAGTSGGLHRHKKALLSTAATSEANSSPTVFGSML